MEMQNTSQNDHLTKPVSLLAVAYRYHQAGYNILPVRPDKKPIVASWEQWKGVRQTTEEIESLSWDRASGISVICGKVSGGLVCIDVDSKHDLTGTLRKEIGIAIETEFPGLLNTLPVERTPSGGLHFVFKTDTPIANLKLARRPAIADERGACKDLIETRGEGGYFVCAPSSGYILRDGPGIDQAPIIPVETALAILDICRTLNTYVPADEAIRAPAKSVEGWEISPLDDYNQRTTDQETLSLLTARGWRARERGQSWELTRPDGNQKSATFNRVPGCLYVFSSSALPFDQNKTYSKAAVYAYLEHGGDFHKAASALAKSKYGKPKRRELTAVVQGGEPSDIHATLLEIQRDYPKCQTERNRFSAEAVVKWLHKRGRFFHTEDRDFRSCMFFDAGRKLLLSIRSDEFLSWLSDALIINRVEKIFSFITAAVETEGLSARSTEIEPARFWAAKDGFFYLSNGAGSMAKISADGIEIVDNGTDDVLFRSSETLRPWKLTTPADPFEACSLFSGMSTTDQGKLLFKIWAISLPTDPKTKPLFLTTGQFQSGKTRPIRGIQELYGIPEVISSVKARDGEGDFWTVVDRGGLVCFDNVDTRVTWLTEALQIASTGGTFAKRKLYTDGTPVNQKARSWVALTSANPAFAENVGLSDRLLVVRMDRREKTGSDSEMSAEISRNRDAGLSWICHALSGALSSTETVPDEICKRHKDFGTLAVRIGQAIAKGSEAVVALGDNEQTKAELLTETDNILAVLLQCVSNRGTLEGTPGEIRKALIETDQSLVDDKFFTPHRLSNKLTASLPYLKKMMTAEVSKDSHKKTKVFKFCGYAGIAGGQTQNLACNELHKEFCVSTSAIPAHPQTVEPGWEDDPAFIT